MSFFERPPVTLYLVRHGQSEANVDKNVYRHKPDHAIDLTEKGIAQATEAGDYFRSLVKAEPQHGKMILLQSPYMRARSTADHIYESVAEYIQERVELPELVEQQFGLFDGVPPDELNQTFPREYARYKLAQRHMGQFWACPPQGESLFQVYQRATTVAHYIRFAHRRDNCNTFMLVAHAGWLQCFLMAWCNLPYESAATARALENCEIMKVVAQEIIGSVFIPSLQTHEPGRAAAVAEQAITKDYGETA